MKVRKQLLLLGLLPAVALLYSCAEEPPPRPVVEVVVDEVVLEPYRPQSEYVGRLLARDDVTIEARISGYLLTQPPEGQPRLTGADASHAWFSVWCPEFGWVDFDPTNDLIAVKYLEALARQKYERKTCP